MSAILFILLFFQYFAAMKFFRTLKNYICKVAIKLSRQAKAYLLSLVFVPEIVIQSRCHRFLGELEDMEKVDVTFDCFSYPMPCALVGVNVEGKPNYLTVGWFSMVNFEPTYIS
jgi:hypothetical protein